MADQVMQASAKTLDEQFVEYSDEHPTLGTLLSAIVATGVATQVATDNVIEDAKGLGASAKAIVDAVAASDHPLDTTIKYAGALGEGTLVSIKNIPDAVVQIYENFTSQLDTANRSQGLNAAAEYGALGGAVFAATISPSHGKGKAVGEGVEGAVRHVEGELVDKASNEVLHHAASTSGNSLTTAVERAKHIAEDAKSAIKHPAETLLRKAGLIDVDTVLMDIAHKPMSLMESMDIRHHGAGEQMIAALEAQKLKRANALLKLAAENPAAAEQLKKANHTQLERLVMSAEADGFLGVKPLPQMLQRPLTANEQHLQDSINRITEFTGGAADVAAAKQRQAARENMTQSEMVVDWLKTHMTYPGGHRPSVADADGLALAAEHSDSKALVTLDKGVAEKIVVGKAIVGGMMYLALSDSDKEKSANAFLKAAHVHNGFDSEQFKKEHPELLGKAVPMYKAMEQVIYAQYSQNGHTITSAEQNQIDCTMQGVANNIAAIIKKDGPGMEGKDEGKALQNSSAECAASI